MLILIVPMVLRHEREKILAPVLAYDCPSISSAHNNSLVVERKTVVVFSTNLFLRVKFKALRCTGSPFNSVRDSPHQ